MHSKYSSLADDIALLVWKGLVVMVKEIFFTACLSIAIIIGPGTVCAEGVSLGFRPMYQVITADSLWAQIESGVQRALKEQRPDGNFEQDPNARDIGNNNIGVVSLLALYEHETGGSEEIRQAAVDGLKFWLKERVRRKDPKDNRYITKRNSGQAYTPYMLNGDRANGDFPTTAWSLINACHVLLYAEFLESDLHNELMETALSMWRWLTEVSVWDPQNTQNQALGAIVGGLKLAQITGDSSIKDKAINIYETKVRPGRVLDRGYKIFHEHGGYDAHYSSMSLHFVAEAHMYSGHGNFLDDGLEMAKYIDMRMSQNGYDYGGTRWDETGRNDADAFFVGFCYFAPYVKGDLTRFLVGYKGPDSHSAERLGHFSMGLIPSYIHFKRGGEREDVVVYDYSIQKGSTSVTFSKDHLPYLISVGNVDFLESVVDGVHGNGFYYERANKRYPAFSVKSTTHETLSFGNLLIREVVQEVYAAELVQIGLRTMPFGTGDNLTTRSLYILDGEELYVINTARFGQTTQVENVGWMIGLPYLHMKDGIGKKVISIDSDNEKFLLSVAGGELSSDEDFVIGDASISGSPSLFVRNPDWSDPRWTFNSQLAVDASVRDLKFWSDVENTNHFMAKRSFSKPVAMTPKDSMFFLYRIAPETVPQPKAFLQMGEKGQLEAVFIQTQSFVYVATVGSYLSDNFETNGTVELLMDITSNEYVGSGNGELSFRLNGSEYRVRIDGDSRGILD